MMINKIKDRCCGANCYCEDEECWGDVDVIDEVEEEDGDYCWVHACEGHAPVWMMGDKFKPEPIDPSNK